MGKYILSIDQGTTSCRAIVFDKTGKTLGVGQLEFEQIFPKPSWVEHNPQEILDKQIECIKQAVKNAGVKAEEIACVGVTNQRETTVVWEKATGKPIYNAIVWQCRRTSEFAEGLKDNMDLFRLKTGLVPDAYFSGPKIRWILDNVPGARKRAEAGELLFGTIDTWLIWNLTKEKTHATEGSNASRTMLFNINTMTWDDELLDIIGVPKAVLPTVLPSNADFGHTIKEQVGFEAPILGNLGDQQAALFGQCCFEEGMAKCTYGTGSFLLANIGNKPRLAKGLLTTVGWQLEGEKPTYAFEGAIFIAGAAVQWLRDGLGIIESSDETEKLARSLPSNEGVYFVPALVGLGSPWWNSDVRGTIVGITRGTGRSHFVRATLESMAYQVADVAHDMQENGIVVKELRVDGGATKNTFMMEFQADVLGVPVTRATNVEATAWGAAALAGLKAGLIKDLAELNAGWQKDLKVSPASDRQSELAGWRKALDAAFAF
ncbi:MAG: glycerol kinase GlpK [Candidatus Obscuribacter phosphatis]|uniref:Glycerol kinase n=1 Tax=Candidatus Obscuribacter phosphatis TaxID=1906157 RepID=A0A8J7PFF1_9BACT|nr:glycerol kinase GlpK [Candidatus Obscuribacter phosphatis]